MSDGELQVRDGFLFDIECRNESNEKVYPYFVKKRGRAAADVFDVSLSGSSNEYRGVTLERLIELFAEGAFDHRGTIRMRPLAGRSAGGGQAPMKGRISEQFLKRVAEAKREGIRSRPPRTSRISPSDTRNRLTAILAEYASSSRTICLDFLTDSVRFISSRSSDRWAITVSPDCLRFSVGWTNVIVLEPAGISVLVDEDPSVGIGSLAEQQYIRAGGSRLLVIAATDVNAVLHQVRARHEAAILLAARSPMPPHVRSAHSPTAVDLCWRYLDLPEPVPVPVGTSSEHASAVAPHQVSDKALDDEAEKEISARADVGPTQKERLVKARVGQGLFRRNVEFVESACRVTGVRDLRHLRASHIKPWRLSNDEEKLDGHNGLLLAPHIDHLFDKGYISFSDDGCLLVAMELDRSVLACWRVAHPMNVGGFRPEQRRYLAFHRSEIFGACVLDASVEPSDPDMTNSREIESA